ncbi:hypothetical protein ACLBXO_26700 [Methylobacterium sp. C33D]
MLDDFADTPAATHVSLAHERAVRTPRRRVRLLGIGCLGLAFLGTASTVRAWETPPTRHASVDDEGPNGGRHLAQPAHGQIDLGTFAAIAGR